MNNKSNFSWHFQAEFNVLFFGANYKGKGTVIAYRTLGVQSTFLFFSIIFDLSHPPRSDLFWKTSLNIHPIKTYSNSSHPSYLLSTTHLLSTQVWLILESPNSYFFHSTIKSLSFKQNHICFRWQLHMQNAKEPEYFYH